MHSVCVVAYRLLSGHWPVGNSIAFDKAVCEIFPPLFDEEPCEIVYHE